MSLLLRTLTRPLIVAASVGCALLLAGCHFSNRPRLTHRDYQVEKSDSATLLRIGVDARNSYLYMEGPNEATHRSITVELIGKGTEREDGFHYTYPADLKLTPREGNKAHARMSRDRTQVVLEVYWERSDGARAPSLITGTYDLTGHEKIPPGEVLATPARLSWSADEAGLPKTVMIRTGSPASLRVRDIPTRAGQQPIAAALARTADENVWQLTVTPPVVGNRLTTKIAVDAWLRRKKRTAVIWLEIAAAGANRSVAAGSDATPLDSAP